MQRKRIVVDFDDVIFDLNRAIVKFLQRECGITINYDDIDRWSYYYEHKKIKIWADERDLMDCLFNIPQVFLLGEFVPGAVDALQILNENHDVLIASACSTLGCTIRERLLLEKMNFLKSSQICRICDKSWLSGYLHIDDYQLNLFHSSDILFSRPWNIRCSEDFVRCDNWASILDHLYSINLL